MRHRFSVKTPPIQRNPATDSAGQFSNTPPIQREGATDSAWSGYL